MTNLHADCDYADKQVRCDRCGTEYVCTPASDFYCTPEGDHCCEPCLIGGKELHVYEMRKTPDGIALRRVPSDAS